MNDDRGCLGFVHAFMIITPFLVALVLWLVLK
jgi:hypothetical protein